MPLFTVLLDFEGGTYVSQVRALSVGEALISWADSLRTETIEGIGPSERTELTRRANLAVEVVQLRGLSKVWCQSHLLQGKLALLHIVETSSCFVNSTHCRPGRIRAALANLKCNSATLE